MSRAVNDTATFEFLFAHIIPEMITNIGTTAGVVTILIPCKLEACLSDIYTASSCLAVAGNFIRKIRPGFRRAQKAVGELNSKLQDNFLGIHEVQAFGQERHEYKNIEKKPAKSTTSAKYSRL